MWVLTSIIKCAVSSCFSVFSLHENSIKYCMNTFSWNQIITSSFLSADGLFLIKWTREGPHQKSREIRLYVPKWIHYEHLITLVDQLKTCIICRERWHYITIIQLSYDLVFTSYHFIMHWGPIKWYQCLSGKEDSMQEWANVRNSSVTT